MTDIFTLPLGELRGYARGLRDATERFSPGGYVNAIGASLTREADLIEGFAARLEGAKPAHRYTPGPTFAAQQWCASFEALCMAGCDGKTCERARHAAASVLHELEQRAAGTHRETEPMADEEQAQTGLADAVAEHLAEAPPLAEPEGLAQPNPTPAPIRQPEEARQRAQRSDSPWTDERLALLRRLFPTLMHLDAIHAALNALPGQPIASPGSTKVKASNLGLHRRGEPIPEEFAQARETGRLGRPPAHVQGRTENGAKPGTWTPERERVLRRDYPTDKPPTEILRELNALPGPAVVSSGALYAHAKKLGLTRRQPPKVGEPIAPVVTVAEITLTTEEMHELREKFRKKEFGVTWLREEYGLPEPYARQIIQQLRDEAQKKKAA